MIVRFQAANFIKTSVSGRINKQKDKSNLSKSITFEGVSNYADFSRRFKKLKLTTKDFVKLCNTNENRLNNGGSEGYVYKIPIEGFENYLLKVNNKFKYSTIKKLEEVKTPFGHRNFGQAIANIGEHVQILKKVEGADLVRFLDKTISDTQNFPDACEQYYKTLAEIPQKEYYNFTSKLSILNHKGYRFDPNSGNIMITPNKKIKIIDVLKHGLANFLGDSIYPFFDLNFESPKVDLYKKIIIQKLFKAAKKQKLIYGMNDSLFDELYQSQDKTIKACLDDLLKKYLTS